MPLIHRMVLEYNEKVLLLLTVRDPEVFVLLRTSLPERVMLHLVPADTPVAVSLFLQHWQPSAGIFLSSDVTPNLVVMAAEAGVPLALLDAHVSRRTFARWHTTRVLRRLFARAVSTYRLIIPQSDVDVGRFRLMGATLAQMPGWCSDLRYALTASANHMWRPRSSAALELQLLLADRVPWVAANLAAEEQEALAETHTKLKEESGALLTVFMPSRPHRSACFADELAAKGARAVLWSSHPTSLVGVDVLIMDSPWQLPLVLTVCELVYFGSEQLPGDQNHSQLAQAAVSGCAIVTSADVAAHMRLAEDLNSAAVSVAQETATAVHTAGVAMDDSSPRRPNTAGAAPASPGSRAAGGASPASALPPRFASPRTAPAAAAGPRSPFFAPSLDRCLSASNSRPASPMHPDSASAAHSLGQAQRPWHLLNMPELGQSSLSAQHNHLRLTSPRRSASQSPAHASAEQAFHECRMTQSNPFLSNRTSLASEAQAHMLAELDTSDRTASCAQSRRQPADPVSLSCGLLEENGEQIDDGRHVSTSQSSVSCTSPVSAPAQAHAHFSPRPTTARHPYRSHTASHLPGHPPAPRSSLSSSRVNTPTALTLRNSWRAAEHPPTQPASPYAYGASDIEQFPSAGVGLRAEHATCVLPPHLMMRFSGDSVSTSNPPASATAPSAPAGSAAPVKPPSNSPLHRTAPPSSSANDSSRCLAGPSPLARRFEPPRAATGSMLACQPPPTRPAATPAVQMTRSAPQTRFARNSAPPLTATPATAAQMPATSAAARHCTAAESSLSRGADLASSSAATRHPMQRASSATTPSVPPDETQCIPQPEGDSAADLVLAEPTHERPCRRSSTFGERVSFAPDAVALVECADLGASPAAAGAVKRHTAPKAASAARALQRRVSSSQRDVPSILLDDPMSPVGPPPSLPIIRTHFASPDLAAASAASGAAAAAASSSVAIMEHGVAPSKAQNSHAVALASPAVSDTFARDAWAGTSPYARLSVSHAAHQRPFDARLSNERNAVDSAAGGDISAEPGCAASADAVNEEEVVADWISPRTQPHMPLDAANGSRVPMEPMTNAGVDKNARVDISRALLRYRNQYVLSAAHLPDHPHGPAVWLLCDERPLAEAVAMLLREPIERRSRGHSAAQAAARLASSLVSTLWDVLDGSVLEPALLAFQAQSSGTEP